MQLDPRGACIVFRNEYYYIIVYYIIQGVSPRHFAVPEIVLIYLMLLLLLLLLHTRLDAISGSEKFVFLNIVCIYIYRATGFKHYKSPLVHIINIINQ